LAAALDARLAKPVILARRIAPALAVFEGLHTANRPLARPVSMKRLLHKIDDRRLFAARSTSHAR
jgi:hypothetical protein